METHLKYPYQHFTLNNLKGELWDDIPSFDGAYELSNYGRIKSKKRYVERGNNRGYWVKEKIIRPRVSIQRVSGDTRSLYRLSVTISFEGKKSSVPIARMVYNLFIKKFDMSDRKLVVSMIDEDSLNICPKNLFLTSPSKNIKKAYEKNRRERASFGNNARSISQYDFKGNWIRTYPSITFASKATGISSGQIARTLQDCDSYASGYIWRYGKQQRKISKLPERLIKKMDSEIFHSTIVTQYTLFGKRTREHKNLKAAAKAVGAQPNMIRKVILGDSLSAKNHYWALGQGPKQISMEPIEKKKLESTQNIRRPVTQFDLTGRKMKSYLSIAEASRALGIHPMNITYALRKEGSSTANGFLWAYGKDESKIKIAPRVQRKNVLYQLYAKAVSQYNQEGLRIVIYNSILEASEATDTPLFSLVNCVTGKALSYKGLYWRLGKGPVKISVGGLSGAHQKLLNKISKPVIQYTLAGKKIREFPSLGAASKATNTSVSQIRMVALGKYKCAKGYSWKFK
jgi:hypothetical protein